MNTTVKTFNKSVDLPEWAQKHDEVVALAREDYAFRADCWRYAESAQWRGILLRRAREWYG